jgi:class 3 adenylate cyclase/tetratricopeptide (TPR) repeat protein
MGDVRAWLERIGLGRYAEAFAANDIEWDVLPSLTEADLTQLGLSLGHRKRFLGALASLDPAQGQPPGTTGSERADTPATPESVAGDAERRQITVLFCDLVGSTALSERLDPEDLRDVIRAYQTACAEAVARWDGHLAQYLGDGVMAYFGYPIAHEDDAARAVGAGLDMLAAVAKLDGAMGRERGVSLRARIGAHTGLVIAGEMGGGKSPDRQAIVGETPNVAARLEALAEPQSLVIGPTTARLVQDQYDLEPLGAQQIRGLSQPLHAWRVRGQRDLATRFEARAARGLTPLVGRRAEIAMLMQRWRQACDGEAGVVLVAGEAGIGKSRTIRAFREAIKGEPYSPVLYYCSPHHRNTALWPASEQLRRVANFAEGDATEVMQQKLSAALAGAASTDDWCLPYLSAWLGLPAALPSDLSPQHMKKRTLEALVATIANMARRGPLLMVVEDAHWIDPSTYELIQQLVERPPEGAFLLLVSARPEFTPDWNRWPHFTQLMLVRLGRRERAALIQEVTHGKSLPQSVVDQIVTRTDGVPLFVEELTKTVLESGLLQDEGDGFSLVSPELRLAIPSTLQDSLMARLDRLATVKDVAQIGAVIGRSFDFRMLAAVAGMSERTLCSAMDRLVAAGLIHARGEPPNPVYEFKHALVQDAAYASLLKPRRQLLHGRIAQAAEGAEPFRDHPELIAHHYSEAGETGKAVRYWMKAAQLALSRSSAREAEAHAQAGLREAALLSDPMERLPHQIDLFLALGAAAGAARGYTSETARDAYLKAASAARRLDAKDKMANALWGLFAVRYSVGAIADAMRASEEILDLSEQAANKEMRCFGERALGACFNALGNVRQAYEHTAEAVRLYREGTHSAPTAQHGHDMGVAAYSQFAWAAWHSGRLKESEEAAEAAISLARRFSHASTLAYALHFSGALIAAFRDEFGALSACAQELIDLHEQHHLPLWRSGAVVFHAIASIGVAPERDSRAAIEQGIAGCEAIGSYSTHPLLLTFLARACLAADDLGGAADAIERAESFAVSSGVRFWAAETARIKSALLRRQGDLRGSDHSLRQAIAIASEQGSEQLRLRAENDLETLRSCKHKQA